MSSMRKLFIFNLAGLCVVLWALFNGYIHRLIEADGAHMTLVIAAMFVVGLVSTFWWSLKIDKRLSQRSWSGGERARVHVAIVTKTAHLHDVLAALFILGIVGNAIGFLSAFSGIETSSLTTPEGMRAAGAQMLSGSGTAFGSTIVGLSLALWTMGNLRILSTAIDWLAPNG